MRNWTSSYRTCLLSLAATAALAGSAHAGFMFDWKQNQTIASIDSEQYDLAVGGGRAHIAYQNAGGIYYISRSIHAGDWTAPRLIGTGSLPSIAVDPAGVPHIAYNSDGSILVGSAGSDWSPVTIGTGTYASLGIAGDGVRHLLIEGNRDGDSYLELARTSDAGAGWSAIEVIHDGSYDSGSGGYYGQSSLAALPEGFAYAMESQAWGGKASWSVKYPSAILPGVGSVSMEVAWNTGSSLSRQAISAGEDGVGFAFATAGTVWANAFMDGGWVGFVALGPGGQASTDMSAGLTVAYTDAGQLMFFDGLISMPIEVDGVALGGSNPFVGGDGTEMFVLYRDHAGQLSLVSTTIVPEPGAGALLLIGAGSLLARRRRA